MMHFIRTCALLLATTILFAPMALTQRMEAPTLGAGSQTGAHLQSAEKAMTPLCWAAFSGDLKAVKKLLGKRQIDLKASSLDGDSALSCALIDWVGDPDETGSATAARRERKARAFFLLLPRSDANAANAQGMTPLHWLALAHFAEPTELKIAGALLKAGADAEAADNNGTTPLRYAQQRNLSNLAGFLTKSRRP